jgi:shikimate kinase
MMKHRRPTYQRVATVTVDTAGRTPEEVVDLVVPALEGASA